MSSEPGNPDNGKLQRYLSHNKKTASSSSLDANPSRLAVNEEIRDYWSAKTGDKGEWLSVDLGNLSSVSAVQLNFSENNTQLFGRDTNTLTIRSLKRPEILVRY